MGDVRWRKGEGTRFRLLERFRKTASKLILEKSLKGWFGGGGEQSSSFRTPAPRLSETVMVNNGGGGGEEGIGRRIEY